MKKETMIKRNFKGMILLLGCNCLIIASNKPQPPASRSGAKIVKVNPPRPFASKPQIIRIPIGSTAADVCSYQLADRMGNGKTNGLVTFNEGDPLMPATHRGSTTYRQMANRMVAKFPDFFTADQMNTHIAQLATENPDHYAQMKNYLEQSSGNANVISDANRKHRTETSEIESAKFLAAFNQCKADKFLQQQIMNFLKNDRNAQQANASKNEQRAKWYKKSFIWSTIWSGISLTYYVVNECLKKQCK